MMIFKFILEQLEIVTNNTLKSIRYKIPITVPFVTYLRFLELKYKHYSKMAAVTAS
jgi:hypothetical protein